MTPCDSISHFYAKTQFKSWGNRICIYTERTMRHCPVDNFSERDLLQRLIVLKFRLAKNTLQIITNVSFWQEDSLIVKYEGLDLL